MREFFTLLLFIAAVLFGYWFATTMWENCRAHHAFWHCSFTKGLNI